jgi:hypothetical protein
MRRTSYPQGSVKQPIKPAHGLKPLVAKNQPGGAEQGAGAKGMVVVAGVANHALAVVVKRLWGDHGRRGGAGRLQHAGHGGVSGQLRQAHDLRRGQLHLPLPVLRQRDAGADPYAVSCLMVVVAGHLTIGHRGQKKRVSKRLLVTEGCRGAIQRDQGNTLLLFRRKASCASMVSNAWPSRSRRVPCSARSAQAPWANKTPDSSNASRMAATYKLAAVRGVISCSFRF